MNKLLLLSLVPFAVLADQCVLQDKTVSRHNVVLEERADIRAEVVPTVANQRKCMVSLRARIGDAWHTGFGEYEWLGDRPRAEACAVATKRAEDSVLERVARARVVSEKTLVCRDDPDIVTLSNTNPGSVGNLSQFRPHPDRPREFWHNGAPCRYFLDSTYVRSDIRTFEGVICKIHDSKWVVIDKF